MLWKSVKKKFRCNRFRYNKISAIPKEFLGHLKFVVTGLYWVLAIQSEFHTLKKTQKLK